MGTLEECRAQIARELRYQSSLDLDEATYSAIRHLPLAKDLVRASRQQLVAHLDGYAKRHKELFERVRRLRPAVSLLLPAFVPTKASCSQHQGPAFGQGLHQSSQAAAAGSSGCRPSAASSSVSRRRELGLDKCQPGPALGLRRYA